MKLLEAIAALLLVSQAGMLTAADASLGAFKNLHFTVDGVSRTAAMYVPPGYDTSKPRPLIVYLHGGGGGGDNAGNALTEWMDKQQIVRAIRANPDRFRALVLVPRCPTGKIWAPVPTNPIQSEWRFERHGPTPKPDAEEHVTAAIAAAVEAYSVDQDRITLAGHSMGGEGSTRYAALHADRIAGVAPSAGSAVIVPEAAPALASMGVWMFQGETDNISTVKLARQMVAAIRAAGGEPRYTEYEGVGHATANLAYNDAKVIEWLLQQKS